VPPHGTIAGGLSETEAASRLANYGPNVLPTPPRIPAWRRFASELVHFFALLFWVAGGLAFVAGLPELGFAVFVVIILNALFAFVQEQRAEHAAEQLQRLLPGNVTVVRDGVAVERPARELVPGDLVIVGEGDRICADLRTRRVHSLAVDTAALTGESVPQHPNEGEPLFAGYFVVEGEAEAIVEATGAATRLATIARLTRAQQPAATPLRLELERVSRIIAIVAVAVGLCFFIAALLLGSPASNGFVFAIGVAVAVVPEGLLPTVTLSLAIGGQRMAARNALVRHLEAVETLGSTTFICTDKTGTLTRNEMTVVEVWMPEGRVLIDGVGYEPTAIIRSESDDAAAALQELARIAARCSSGTVVQDSDGAWIARGDPMEAALDALARRAGVDPAADRSNHPDEARFPFDARRRRMSVVAGDLVMVKGAPDSVFPLCDVPPGAEEALHELAARGLRATAEATSWR
jgi:magnesium-transporting ATPase (P-type)